MKQISRFKLPQNFLTFHNLTTDQMDQNSVNISQEFSLIKKLNLSDFIINNKKDKIFWYRETIPFTIKEFFRKNYPLLVNCFLTINSLGGIDKLIN
jgi:hypothetical protein